MANKPAESMAEDLIAFQTTARGIDMEESLLYMMGKDGGYHYNWKHCSSPFLYLGDSCVL
jgi:hypothetical protein